MHQLSLEEISITLFNISTYFHHELHKLIYCLFFNRILTINFPDNISNSYPHLMIFIFKFKFIQSYHTFHTTSFLHFPPLTYHHIHFIFAFSKNQFSRIVMSWVSKLTLKYIPWTRMKVPRIKTLLYYLVYLGTSSNQVLTSTQSCSNTFYGALPSSYDGVFVAIPLYGKIYDVK